MEESVVNFYSNLEGKLNYSFSKGAILPEALAVDRKHKNGCSKQKRRLIYLGQRVLELVLLEYLLKQKRQEDVPSLEVTLSKIKGNDLKSHVAELLELNRYIKDSTYYPGQNLGYNADNAYATYSGTSTMADCFTALVGGIYLDCDYKMAKVKELIYRWYKPYLSLVGSEYSPSTSQDLEYGSLFARNDAERRMDYSSALLEGRVDDISYDTPSKQFNSIRIFDIKF